MIQATQRQTAVEPILVSVQKVAPGEAAAWRFMYHYGGQRVLRPHWVDHLAQEMKAGRFKQGTSIAFAVEPGGQRKLINGQHTLAAIVSSATAQSLVVIEHMSSGPDETAALYATYDQGMKRSPVDGIDPDSRLGRILPSKTDKQAVAAAVKAISEGIVRRRFKAMSPIVQRDLMHEYADAAQLYFQYIQLANTKLDYRFRRSPVVAVALVTIMDAIPEIGGETVEAFWRGAAQDDGLAKGDPRKFLIEHLKSCSLSNIAQSGKQVSPSYMAHYTAACWNRWTEGNTNVGLIKVMDESAPMRLNYTRFRS